MWFMCCLFDIFVTTLIVSRVSAQSSIGIKLDISPENGKARLSQDVTLTCVIDTGIVGNAHVKWIRQTGDLKSTIAMEARNEDDFVGSRYRVTTRGEVNKKKTYMLTITGTRQEDSGTFYCNIIDSSRSESRVLAVCADPESTSCGCVHDKGWASPDCFGGAKSQSDLEKDYDRSVTGLAVCFAIAVIYGIVITVMFARDCVRIIRQKRKHKAHMLAHTRTRHPYTDSEKLTLDGSEETASQPESGVWSQSEGSNGNRNPELRQDPALPTAPSAPDYDYDSAARKRPQVIVQAHVNAAFNPEELLTEKPAPSPRPIRDKRGNNEPEMGGAKPKAPPPRPSYTPSGLHAPETLSAASLVGSPAVAPPGEYIHFPKTPSGDYSQHYTPTTPSSATRTPRTPDLESYSERRLPNEVPPSGTQSEHRGQHPDHLTALPNHGAYTDVSDKYPHKGSHGNHYTEPRRLDFINHKSSHRDRSPSARGLRDRSPSGRVGDVADRSIHGHGGAYIDSHDTEI